MLDNAVTGCTGLLHDADLHGDIPCCRACHARNKLGQELGYEVAYGDKTYYVCCCIAEYFLEHLQDALLNPLITEPAVVNKLKI